MFTPTHPQQALDQSALSPHINATCGKSRSGGLVTSESERRSGIPGRVAVAHVQGSPKGGGALGSLRVTSTRLRPVPPINKEGPMRRTLGFLTTIAISIAAPMPVQAQLFGGSGLSQSSEMKQVCQQRQIAIYFAGTIFGYYVPSGGGDMVAIKKANDLAEELVSRSTISDWTFLGWSGGRTNGSCLMRYHIDLAPEDAAHFNNDPVIEGRVYVNVVNQDGQWRVASFTDQAGSGPNSAQSFARPFTEQMIAQRDNDERLRAEQQRRDAEAERQRAQQAYWDAHPKEYQEFLARQRAAEAKARTQAKAKAEEEARKARGCENAGGTWGRRTNSYGAPIGPVGCFFQTVGR